MTTQTDVAPASAGTTRPRTSTRLVDASSLAIVALASLQPFAAFLATNAPKLTKPAVVVVDAVLWLLVMEVAFVAVRLVRRTRSPLPAALGFVAFNLSFWNFGRWLPYETSSAAARWLGIVLWLVVTALLVRLATKLARWSSASMFVLLLLGIWTAMSLVTYAVARPATDAGDAPTLAPVPDLPAFTERPNVYWFVLDEHANAPEVERWTGTDTSWFAEDLEARGFTTSSSSHSGYLFTHLSMSSTLAMAYAYEPGRHYPTEYPLAVPILQGENPVVATFEANGYRYVFAPDGSSEWADCRPMTGTRTCIDPLEPALSLRGPHTELVRTTPIGSLGLPMVHNDFTSVLDGVDQLRATEPDQPLFVYAHLLTPHYPYRWGPGCEPRSTWIEGTTLSGEERAAAYGNEVECVDREAIRAFDRIIADDPDAVIIVQGDHGSSLSFNWTTPFDEWSGRSFSERFGALNAMRLPSACADRSIEGEPLVNTFRIVLACLAGTEPDLLDTRVFYSGYGRIDQLAEVPIERLDDP